MFQQRAKKGLLRLITLTSIIMSIIFLSGCVELMALLKPTNIDRISYDPECEKAWEGKTVYIDFDVNRSYWSYRYASNLAYDIRDKLIEDVVNDGCFHVTDKNIRRNFAYRVGVHISNPRIRTSKGGFIDSVSARFRIKTYDNKNNLVKAPSRKIKYERPSFVVKSGNSQEDLLDSYTHNVSVEIRKMFYESLRDNVSNRSRFFKTSAAVNFRSGPSSKTKILMKLAKNTRIYPTGKKKGKWRQVKAKGKKGWLHSNYIK